MLTYSTLFDVKIFNAFDVKISCSEYSTLNVKILTSNQCWTANQWFWCRTCRKNNVRIIILTSKYSTLISMLKFQVWNIWRRNIDVKFNVKSTLNDKSTSNLKFWRQNFDVEKKCKNISILIDIKILMSKFQVQNIQHQNIDVELTSTGESMISTSNFELTSNLKFQCQNFDVKKM